MMDLQEIFSRSKIVEKNIQAVYPYGSRVYGNFRKNSDYDFVIILKEKNNEQFSDNLININFFTEEEHLQRLHDHEISALECYFLPDEKVLMQKKTYSFDFVLSKLRKSLSAKTSNSWVKAKKKLTVPESYDLDLGRKSMFHAFRILDFGIQIAEGYDNDVEDFVLDYARCNPLFEEIMQHYDWQSMFENFKQRYNEKCSEFRIVAPKD